MACVCEMEELTAWKEIMVASLTDPSRYHGRNEDYDRFIPQNELLLAYDSIGEWEPHSGGIGYYDDPDESMFTRYYWPSWRKGTMPVPTVKVRRCQDALDLAMGNLEQWINMLTPNISPWSAVDTSSDFLDDAIIYDGEENIVFPLPTHLRHAVWDFSDFEDSSTHPSISVTLLALFLSMPNLESLCISRLRLDPMANSLFAHFPVPLENVKSYLDDLGVPTGLIIHSKLESLQFSNSQVSTGDIYFLGDCAIHNKVLPLLRNIKFYYCQGMSYSSIIKISPVVNLVFDRWECSGWCWPQEVTNPKNQCTHI